jgi:hypothetical protein
LETILDLLLIDLKDCNFEELWKVYNYIGSLNPEFSAQCKCQLNLDSLQSLIREKLNELSNSEVGQVYKYVRRYVIANIPGLSDPFRVMPHKKCSDTCSCTH